MIIDPPIIGLIFTAMTGMCFLIYASGIGARIIIQWDIKNGDERQLILERKTCLISIILYYVMICEFLSLFLFVFIAEDIHTLFTGSMCAAGTLNVNRFGYPFLLMKLISFILCGIWAIINYVDNKGFDYPIIRFKYAFLIIITGLIICETAFLINYFFRLTPDIITSCCGTLFNEDSRNMAAQIISLPSVETKILFYALLALTIGSGTYFCLVEKSPLIFSFFSIVMLPLCLASVISFISVYFYQQPTHHCPFCLLKKEYSYVGYLLYLTLFIAAITGAGTGFIHFFKKRPSVQEVIPKIQKRLCGISISGYAVFALITSYPIVFSDFKIH